MRLKIIRDYEKYKTGQVITVGAAKAKLLLKSGAAVITRDVVRTDFKES